MKKIFMVEVCLISVASDMAESGQFETVSNGTVSVATNDFGTSKYSITNIRYTVRVINSNLSFFSVGAISISDCLGTVTVENGKTNGSGTCIGNDAEGDKWRINYVRSDSSTTSVTGTAELIGMTGKYANAKGTCNYDQKRLVLDSAIHVSTLLKCSVSK